ncbi:MAG: hypothetical protein EOO20_07640 [Chryseobacterium sp.]|nr:MAG: hypothetical protein EOO20_07640 [Chryseobacterium sp.]
MFLPYFIALILGLVNPAESSTSNCHSTTQVSSAENNTGDDGTPDDSDTGGETGQTPPPKID